MNYPYVNDYTLSVQKDERYKISIEDDLQITFTIIKNVILRTVSTNISWTMSFK